MVVKEELLDWFKRQPSHQRLDLVCSLLDCCLPFELRFIANCVEVLTKKDAFTYQESEVLSELERNAAGWDPGSAGLGEESVRRKLIFILVLCPSNRIVTHTVFRLLCSPSAFQFLKLMNDNRKPPVTCSSSPDTLSTYHEILLIYTMAMYHPSFTLEEKTQLTSSYVFIKSLVTSLEQIAVSDVSSAQNQLCDKQSQSAGQLPASQQSANRQSNVAVNGTTSDKDQTLSSPSKKFHSNQKYLNGRRTGRSFSNSSYESNRNSRKAEMSNGSAKCNSCCSDSEYLTPQLREQMGPEKFRKFWDKLEKYPIAQLSSLSDEQLQQMGLTPALISRLRKVLRSTNTCHPARHSTQNGTCSNVTVERIEKLRLDSSSEETAPHQRNREHRPGANNSARGTSTMIKSVTGPPNVLPPFSSSSSSSSSSGNQQHPPSRAESLSSSSSSLETSSPPASRSNSPCSKAVQRRQGEQQQRLPPSRSVAANLTGPRPRLPFTGSLNVPYIRPSNASLGNSVGTNAGRQQGQNSRGTSQPRELPLNPIGITLTSGQPTTGYLISNSAPPSNLEATSVPIYSCQSYISITGTGAGEPVSGLVASQYGQPSFAYMTSATSPGTPLSSPYPTASYLIHSHVLTQPLPPPSATSNGRPSVMEYPAFVSQGSVLYPRPDFDFSRPPPSGGVSQVSCYNCGAAGHRGTECRELPLDDVIKPASA